MRVVLSVSAMLVGLLGTYLVGTGVFLPGNTPPDTWWKPILIPLANPHPLSWLFLTVSVALAFFGDGAVNEGAFIWDPYVMNHKP
ncbi:MAG TPA: hypothetical protein PLZ80_15040, partial [Planctomycetota bacterium]|nr:hypothetical protein [Planctomycetota bacterium]